MSTTIKALGAAAFLAGSLGLASAASAAPASPVPGIAGGDLIEHVAQGCGPGFFRGPYGGCRPMRGGWRGPGWRGPGFAYGRRCWVRPTPFGPRRVCR